MGTNCRAVGTARSRQMYGLIEQYLSSGQKQQSFCEDVGLPITTFHYWLYRYRSEQRSKEAEVKMGKKSGLLALEPPQSARFIGEYNIEISLPNGITLRLSGQPDATWLSEVVALLGR